MFHNIKIKKYFYLFFAACTITTTLFCMESGEIANDEPKPSKYLPKEHDRFFQNPPSLQIQAYATMITGQPLNQEMQVAWDEHIQNNFGNCEQFWNIHHAFASKMNKMVPLSNYNFCLRTKYKTLAKTHLASFDNAIAAIKASKKALSEAEEKQCQDLEQQKKYFALKIMMAEKIVSKSIDTNYFYFTHDSSGEFENDVYSLFDKVTKTDFDEQRRAIVKAYETNDQEALNAIVGQIDPKVLMMRNDARNIGQLLFGSSPSFDNINQLVNTPITLKQGKLILTTLEALQRHCADVARWTSFGDIKIWLSSFAKNQKCLDIAKNILRKILQIHSQVDLLDSEKNSCAHYIAGTSSLYGIFAYSQAHAIMYAEAKNEFTAVLLEELSKAYSLKELLALLNHKNRDGKTALAYAVENVKNGHLGAETIAQQLLDAGAYDREALNMLLDLDTDWSQAALDQIEQNFDEDGQGELIMFARLLNN